MSQHVLWGKPNVDITLRKSAKARRISLRISGLDGRVTLTVPRGVSEREGLKFAQQKEGWIRDQLLVRPDAVQIRIGCDIPIEGQLVRITPVQGRRIALYENQLLVPGPDATVGTKVKAWLKTRARDRLVAASDHYAQQLDRSYARISIRDTRSRWGSCSSSKGLMYSWRLYMAPPEVLNYVAAHEVAHLKEMNHSPAFWSEVHNLYPDYETPRRWLRENGSGLHLYQFGD
ncbi:M48 family metallopeptidase [Roseovarius sp. EL26]|uniref:M48 family metallopeptidase n=1 Tax=Roseovarius sp. EL26 TaxID=2126672 RepID=UPI000EA2D9A4|nr:SprT family zinc-dependent metalloprotease [Roseovarius sp. EL26]